jgi:hypothetical protein
MKFQTERITTEHLLYLIAFGIALGLRFLNLGDIPLSDYEAAEALQSWYAVRGETINIGTNPGYFSLTTLIFWLLPVSNATARLWPALVGSLVVFVPFGFRRLFRPEAALIIAFGLALDPGMVTVSRLAGGPMMVVSFVLLALAFVYNRKPIWAGIAGGLALVSGSAIFMGLVGFLVTVVVGRLAGLQKKFGILPPIDGDLEEAPSTRKEIRLMMTTGVATILLVSTLFLRYPSGLGALGRELGNYFGGWIITPNTPILQPLLALIAYQPFAFVFAIISSIRGWYQRDNTSRWLSIWIFVLLLSSLLYPGRQVSDLVWVLTPLWVLAAAEFLRYLKAPQFSIPAICLAGAVIVLSILFWLMSLNPAPITETWVILAAIPSLILLVTVMVGLGWAWEAAKAGFVWGLSSAVGLYLITALFSAAHLRFNTPEALWTPSPGTVQAGLLVETLEELALLENGRTDSMEITSTVESPSLKWALRQFSGARYTSELDLPSSSSVVITPENAEGESDLSSMMSYVGQDFVWSANPGWSGPLPSEWWKWVTSRQAPIQYESVILWVPSGLLPDQALIGTEDTTLQPAESDNSFPGEGSIE